jgi:hypothetical protein
MRKITGIGGVALAFEQRSWRKASHQLYARPPGEADTKHPEAALDQFSFADESAA